jgi:predicted dehydrogenase
MSPVGIAIVGSSGHAARVAAPVVSEADGVRLVGVLGSSPEKSRALADQYEDCRGYAGWEELGADSEVDAVWVAAGPNSRHVEYACNCLRHGKHVLLDKPMATTKADADELRALADESDRLFMVGYQQRYRLGHEWIRDAIHRDVVGKVRFVRIQRFVRFPYFDGMPDTAESWRSSLADSGGWIVNDIGSHLVDLAAWYLGEPVELALSRTYQLRFTDIESEDTAILVLESESGALVSIQVSSAMATFPSTTEVHGLDGWIRADDTFDSGGFAVTHTGERVDFPHSTNTDVYRVQLADFLRGVGGAAVRGATAAEGAANVAIVEQAASPASRAR